MWGFKRKQSGEQVSHDVDAARHERELSEQRLEDAQVAVIIPLRELREENHIMDLVSRRVRKMKRDAEGK
jgi:hypothetical protein